MRRILLIGLYGLIGLWSCHKQPVAPACKGAPIEYGSNDQNGKGYLMQCRRDETRVCCAYGMVDRDGGLCFHILCQTTDTCAAEWQYMETECPPPPERVDNGREANKSKAEGTKG